MSERRPEARGLSTRESWQQSVARGLHRGRACGGADRIGLILRAGITLPTGDAGAGADYALTANSLALPDVYNSLPSTTMLELGVSPVVRSGAVFARLDLGFDWILDSNSMAADKVLHFDLGVGTDLGPIAVMLESENATLFDRGVRGGMDVPPTRLTLDALAFSLRLNLRSWSPYLAVIRPVHDYLSGENAGESVGMVTPRRRGPAVAATAHAARTHGLATAGVRRYPARMRGAKAFSTMSAILPSGRERITLRCRSESDPITAVDRIHSLSAGYRLLDPRVLEPDRWRCAVHVLSRRRFFRVRSSRIERALGHLVSPRCAAVARNHRIRPECWHGRWWLLTA